MNLENLINSGANITVNVTIADLREFALSLLTAKTGEPEKTEEIYLTTEEAAKMVGADRSTLWRWAKCGYLVPLRIGGRPRYRKSDIVKIMEGCN